MLDFIGDLIGLNKQEDMAAANRQSAERQAEANTALQREFAQHGLRWKVEDAKAAGLHPVFGVGGVGATYSPNPIVLPEAPDYQKSFSSMGQSLNRAFGLNQTPHERKLQSLEVGARIAAIQKDDAIAQYYLSEAARNNQTPAVGMPPSVGMPPAIMPSDGFTKDAESYTGNAGALPGAAFDRVEIKPSESPSSRFDDFSLAAGTAPFWREFDVRGDGTRAMLPWTQEGPGEALENVPWYMWPWVVKENVGKYGWRWVPDMLLGKESLMSPAGRGPTVSGKIRR